MHAMENSTVVPQKNFLKIELPCDPNSTSGYTPPKIESQVLKRYLYIHGHSIIIHNSQEVEATQLSIDRWINKMWSIIHSGILFNLKKQISIHATMWVNLEDITLSEIRQSRKDKYCMIPLI